MSGKQELKLTDDLIRKALQSDFETVDLPPADRVWQRIESGLDQRRVPPGRHSYNWSRFAAVAAACLVLVLGGIGLFQAAHLSSPAADTSEVTGGLIDDITMLETKDTPAERDDFTVAGADDSAGPAAADHAPQDSYSAAERDESLRLAEEDSNGSVWPHMVDDILLLNKTIILAAEETPDYLGAIYSGNGNELLWVKSTAADEDLNMFIAQLGDYIGLGLQDLGEIEGHTRIEAEELSGLAWQEDGRNQALLVIAGAINEEELITIISGDR